MLASISFSQNKNKSQIFNKKNQTFGQWKRTVYKIGSNFEISHRNDTSFLRITKDFPDFWEQATDFFVNKFKNNKKVNVTFYGCSDGSEPASFLITMMSRFPQEVWQKFIKNVKAIDNDPVAITKAKANKYTISKPEIMRLRKMLGDNVDEYFINFPKNDCDSAEVKLTDKITSKIKYRKANVLDDMHNLKKENNIIFARAFWPYLEEKIPLLAYRFGNKIKNNSCLVIEDFDRYGCAWHNADIDNLLRQVGLKKTKVNLVFEK